MVNPEYEAAMEIFRILRSPGAIKIEPFAKGKIDLVEFKLNENNPLNDMKVADIFSKLQVSAALRHPKGRRCLYPRRRVCLKGG